MRMHLLGVFLGLILPANAVEPKGDGKMTTQYFYLPSRLLEQAGAKSEPDPMPAEKGDPPAPRNLLSARAYLEQKGIQFPPGATAHYSARVQMLVVHHTRENLALIRHIAIERERFPVWTIRIETRLVEFQPAAAGQLEMAGTFADLSKKLGARIRPVYANQILANAGCRAGAELGREQNDQKPPARKPGKDDPRKVPDDPELSVEAIVEPDGNTTSVHVEFAYTTPGSSGATRLKADKEYKARDGQITMVEAFNEMPEREGGPPRQFALLVRSQIVDDTGRPAASPPAAGGTK